MSSQTIYFDNPQSISQLQTLAGTNSTFPSAGVPEISQWVNSAGPYAIPGYLNNDGTNSQLKCVTGAFSPSILFRDPLGTSSKMNILQYGNAFSGQSFFYGTGSADSTGRVPTTNDFFFTASSMKLIGGLAMAKMMEEQYFNTNQTIASFLPEFSGNGYYLIDATGTLPATNALAFVNQMTGPDFSTFTGTLGTVNLASITIGDAISNKLAHASYGYAFLGLFAQLSWLDWRQSTTQQTLDMRLAYSQYLGKLALERGRSLGATGACQDVSGSSLRDQYYDFWYGDYNYCTGPITDSISTAIKTIKSGAVPLTWNPLTPNGAQSDGIIFGPQSIETYTQLQLGWFLVGACMNIALRRRGEYTNLSDYIKAKLFVPMGITDATFGGLEPAAPGNYLEQTFRRYYSITTGANTGAYYWYDGTDPAYVSGPKAGSVVFVSEYPNDSFSKLSYGYTNINRSDAYGPDLKSSLRIKIKDYVKFLVMIANKGVYNGVRIMSRTTVTYALCPTSNSASIMQLGSNLDYFPANTTWTIGCAMINGNNNLLEMKSTSTASWAFEVDNEITFARLSDSKIIYWNGISGNSWYCDLDTGNYCLQMTYQQYNGGRIKWESPVQYIAPILAKYI